MKCALAMAVVSMLSTGAWAGEKTADRNPVRVLTAEELEVVKVSKTITDAFNRRDFKTAGRHASADLIATGGDGGAYERPADPGIAPSSYATPPETDQYGDRRDLHIRVHGDVAALNYLITEIEGGGETKSTGEVRLNECFQKRNGHWLLIASSVTGLPTGNQRKAIKVNPEKFQELVGEYEWEPGQVDTLFVQGDRLMQRFSSNFREEEVLFADDKTQFLRSELGWVTMLRDRGGKIVGYLYHEPDGQEFVARKIK